MNPTSVDIKDILVAEGNFEFGVDLFIGTQPPTPLNCVTLFDTTSSPPDGTLDGNTVFFQEGLMIWVRNESYEAAFLQAQGIISMLHNRAGFTQNETFYLYCNLQSGPNALGEGDDEEGIILTLNFNLQRKSGIVPAADFLTFAKLVLALVEGTGVTLDVDEVNQTITINSEGGGGSVAWADITDKPTTFTPSAHTQAIGTITDLQNALNAKVDKVTGKQLSTEDYTTAEKNKLTGIEAGAQVNIIETVKVNNVALTPTAKAVDIQLKTINGTAIEGTGNIEISGGGGFTKQTLTDAASISWNVANGNYAAVTIAGNRTISNPSNFTIGQELIIEITQDGVGGRLITWDSYFTFDGGVIPILSSGAGDVDRLRFFVRSATVISFENAKFDV